MIYVLKLESYLKIRMHNKFLKIKLVAIIKLCVKN